MQTTLPTSSETTTLFESDSSASSLTVLQTTLPLPTSSETTTRVESKSIASSLSELQTRAQYFYSDRRNVTSRQDRHDVAET